MSDVCLAIPGRLTAIDGEEGIVDYGGVKRRAELCLAPSAVLGDMVLVHAGFVIAVLNPKEGRELAALTRQTLLFAPDPPEEGGAHG